MFYASKNYKIVCKENCYHVKNIKPENSITYEKLADAFKDGCVPCKHCMKEFHSGHEIDIIID